MSVSFTLVVSTIAVGLIDALLLTISFHDPSLSAITGSSTSFIPYIKDNIKRELSFTDFFSDSPFPDSLTLSFLRLLFLKPSHFVTHSRSFLNSRSHVHSYICTHNSTYYTIRLLIRMGNSPFVFFGASILLSSYW